MLRLTVPFEYVLDKPLERMLAKYEGQVSAGKSTGGLDATRLKSVYLQMAVGQKGRNKEQSILLAIWAQEKVWSTLSGSSGEEDHKHLMIHG